MKILKVTYKNGDFVISNELDELNYAIGKGYIEKLEFVNQPQPTSKEVEGVLRSAEFQFTKRVKGKDKTELSIHDWEIIQREYERLLEFAKQALTVSDGMHGITQDDNDSLRESRKSKYIKPNLETLKQEIIDELNELHGLDNVKFGESPKYTNGSWALRFTAQHNNSMFIMVEYDVKSKSINFRGYTPLKLASKIIKYFELLEEKQ